MSLVEDGASPAELGEWLTRNAKSAKEAMFFITSANWGQLSPVHVLALRACTPAGAFTETGKSGYMARVGDISELIGLTETIFADDAEFLARAPADLRPWLKALCVVVYDKGIRARDRRVVG